MSGLSVRAYARVRGVSHVAVLKAIKNRRISQNEDGTIDPERANEEWERNTFAGKTMVPPPAGDPPRGGSGVPGGDTTIALYQKAKAKKAVFEAQITELEFNQRSGKLIEVTVAGEFASSVSNIIRDQVSAWPDRLTPMVAASTDGTVIRRILARECDALLRKVSKAIADAGY